MPFNPDIHHRRSVRLQGWDYSSPGLYYITICTHRRECLFGEVIDAEMRLNEFGQIAHDEWLRTEEVRTYVDLDQFVIMPNHVHLLFVLNERDAVGATIEESHFEEGGSDGARERDVGVAGGWIIHRGNTPPRFAVIPPSPFPAQQRNALPPQVETS